MLSRWLASVRKECLLLIRDSTGLSILFLMPMVLVFVMTVIQDSTFKTINEKGIPVVFVNNDNDTLGAMIETELRNNDLCSFVDSIDGKPATAASARQAVSKGKFQIGIVIPRGASAAIRGNVTRWINASIQLDTVQPVSASAEMLSAEIDILIDPVAKKSFVTAITSSLREFISELKNEIMYESFSKQIAELNPENAHPPQTAYARSQTIKFNEIYASETGLTSVPNAVQHNVPAWTIFGMFFISIPLSGSIMKEKSEGSVFRLRTMPNSYPVLMGGKLVVYMTVCLIQFALMFSVGLYILPLLGLPALSPGNNIPGIAIITLATAVAATGYGVLVGTLASTEQQAAIMGSLSILLLSALGGIWVPSYVMPPFMRSLSAFSPLNWSLHGYYELLLRRSGTRAILWDSLKLFIFFIATMAIASFSNHLKNDL